MELKECAYEFCQNEFVPTRHNQRYCSTECSTKANNAKILKKYHERKARLAGGRRICKTPGCMTPLSKYNDKEICNACDLRQREEKRQNMLKEFGL